MKKVLVEKVPEGIRVSVTYETSRAPLVFVLQPAQVTMLVTLLQSAARSETFRFEYQP